MISWLQTNLQKHFRVVFIVLLVVLIVAFVFTIGNQGPLSPRDERTASLVFFDTPLNTEAARTQFDRDAQLSASLQQNRQASPTLAFERATALHIANEHNIPAPSDAQLEEYIKSIPAFQSPAGGFDANSYRMARQSFQMGGMFTESDFKRVLMDDYRIDKVYTVLQGAGFVEESEILDNLSQRMAIWSVMVANADLNSYTPEVEITEEMLRQHYEDFSFTYQTPERRTVAFVEIPAEPFIDEVQASEDELITYFEANIDRYQPEPAEPVEGEEAEAAEPITFEEARLAVRNDYRLEQARELALERAHDLVVEIVDREIARESSELESLVSEMGFEMETSSPFAANETPIGTVWGRNVLSQAFELSEERYYSDPIQVGNNAVVLFYDSVIEPVVPAFDTLRSAIVADVRAEKLREARAAHAIELQEQLASAAESEESFGSTAEEAGMSVTAYREFSLTEPAEGLDRRLFSSLIDLESGEVSDFIRLGGENQGAFVYALSKDIPEVSPEDPQYAQVADSLKSLYGRFAAQQYLQKLMLEEQIRIGIAQPQN